MIYDEINSIADAALLMHRQIVAKHGSDPEVVDHLEFGSRVLDVPRTSVRAIVMYAKPICEVATNDNLCLAACGVWSPA